MKPEGVFCKKSLSLQGSDTCATFPMGCGGEGKGEWVLTIAMLSPQPSKPTYV